MFDFNFLIFPSGFFVDSLGFYTQIIMLSVTKDRFMSSFSNCVLLFLSLAFLHWLESLVKPLNTNSESQNSSPSAEIREEAFILSPSSMMFDVVFVEVFY